MRSVILLVIGLLVGGIGVSLFKRSLPPEPETEAARIAELGRQLSRAHSRIAALEQTDGNRAARLQREAGAGARTIVQDVKDGRLVDLNDVFKTAKPFLHDFAPLFERLRRRELKRSIEHTVADLTAKYHLNSFQQESLKKWLDDRAAREAAQLRDVTTREGTTIVDFAKATREFRPQDGLDTFMEQTLRGPDLEQFRADSMAQRVNRVQFEADRRVEQLNGVVGLDETQQDRVFSLMARSSRDFDPRMQLDGLGDDTTTLAPGQSRDEAILAVLRPDQREQYDEHRARQRAEAERDLNEVGLKLPDDWDMFDN